MSVVSATAAVMVRVCRQPSSPSRCPVNGHRQGLCQAADCRGSRGTALARVPGRTVRFGDVTPQGKSVEWAASQHLLALSPGPRVPCWLFYLSSFKRWLLLSIPTKPKPKLPKAPE